MLAKLIRLPKLRFAATLVSEYHESTRFKPRMTYEVTSNGYLTESQWFEKRNRQIRSNLVVPGGKIIEQPVQVHCNDIAFNTWNKFSEIESIDNRLAEMLLQIGHDEMTPIQRNTFDILNRQLIDLLGSAETGSGKTVAFLAPLINNILRKYPAEMMAQLQEKKSFVQYPLFLVLAPTRELVEQITEEAKRLMLLTNLRAVSVIGGVPQMSQIAQLQRGCHSLIATPGRLIDLVGRGHISLRHCTNLVLDEADRMLDMGFEPQIRQITDQLDLPPVEKRHTAMFSATFPDDVLGLARTLMKREHGRVLIGRDAGSSETCVPQSIEQQFTLCDNNGSIINDCLEYLAKNDRKTIVFCNTKSEVDMLCRFAANQKFDVAALHGDYPQRRRQSELQLFKRSAVKVLVATSIAARGIDVCDVECVVNVGLPMNVDEYMHRVGRCGRLGRSGWAMTFVKPDELGGAVAKDLMKMMRRTDVSVPDFMMRQGDELKTSAKLGRGGRPGYHSGRSGYQGGNRSGYQGNNNKYSFQRGDAGRNDSRYMR